MEINEQKKLAGEKACEYIKDGMIVGLGTGSTAYYTIMKLGERVKAGLNITGVATSHASTKLARELGIKLASVNEVTHIDVTIDGADEFDPQFRGIKGGGGALLFEKIIAKHSRKNIWVVDSAKEVTQLGRFPLPVEVLQFNYQQIFNKLSAANLNPVLRKKDGQNYTTDSQNYILDLQLGKIPDPEGLARYLEEIPGVVEHGLFLDVASMVIVGTEKGPRILEKK